MGTFRYVVADVFTDTPLAGNPVAVFTDGRGLGDEEMQRRALKLREKVLSPEHPDTLTSMSNLARVLDSQGKYEVAEKMQRRALELREKVLGPEHPDSLARVLDS